MRKASVWSSSLLANSVTQAMTVSSEVNHSHSKWMGRAKGQRREGENGVSVNVSVKLKCKPDVH